MPFATRDGVRLHWRTEGSADRPPLVLLHAIGTDVGVWSTTVPLLLDAFRLLRVDLRGHGASDVRKLATSERRDSALTVTGPPSWGG